MFVDYPGCDFDSGPMQNWSLQVLLRELLLTCRLLRASPYAPQRYIALRQMLKARRLGIETWVGIRVRDSCQ